MRFRILHIFLIGILIVNSVSPVFALSVLPAECSDITLLFARGSGQIQNVEDSQEQTYAFYNELKQRVPSDLSLEVIEVEYPAVEVGIGGWQAFKNSLDAEWSWTNRVFGGAYNDSVLNGEQDLKHKLDLLEIICRDKHDYQVILGGYSQGAQVVGNVLDDLSLNTRNKIAYVGLFGDPKFDGESFAARGAVKDDNGYYVDGILASRDDFALAYQGKLESWCRKDNGICQDSYRDLVHRSLSHTDSYQHREIPLAAISASKRLAGLFPSGVFDLSQPQIDTSIYGKLDVMLVVDARYYNSLMDDVGDLRSRREDIIRQAEILGSNLRMGLLAFHDYYPEYHSAAGFSATYQPLTEDINAFRFQLELLYNRGKNYAGNTALQTALGENWRSDAKKMIVFVSNMREEPDETSGVTLSDAITNAVSQEVAIFSVNQQPTLINSAVYERVRETNGLPFNKADYMMRIGDTTVAMLKTMAADRSIYQGQRYEAAPGQTIKFNLSDYSGHTGDAGVHYRWHFPGDQTLGTTEPVISHAFAEPFNGTVRVEVRLDDRTIGMFSVPVEVAADIVLPAPPRPPQNVKVEILERESALGGVLKTVALAGSTQTSPTQTIRLSWNPPTDESAADGYKVWTAEGALLGVAGPHQTSVVIRDVPESADLSLSMATAGATASSEPAPVSEVIDQTPPEDDSGSDDDYPSGDEPPPADDEDTDDQERPKAIKRRIKAIISEHLERVHGRLEHHRPGWGRLLLERLRPVLERPWLSG